ncbi:hypothetical protein [Synergistes jonesii]|uniref:hypothetical protein n=1 Tax=Synergistes jonesii TaxID=2754 RepID=UPI0008724EA2|nr:hypothetical protein [Synergistes jonesii]OFB66855.1 hypothetical protein JS77_12925 [Synergistes jonesii]
MSDIVATQLRIDNRLFAKAKILAAVYDESFNAFASRIIQSEVERYENEHGALPEPLKSR